MIEVEFEGTILECEKIKYQYNAYTAFFSIENLSPGDTYIGKRNEGWKMATVSERLWHHTVKHGHVYGEVNGDTTSVYPYNLGECLKVVNIK